MHILGYENIDTHIELYQQLVCEKVGGTKVELEDNANSHTLVGMGDVSCSLTEQLGVFRIYINIYIYIYVTIHIDLRMVNLEHITRLGCEIE